MMITPSWLKDYDYLAPFGITGVTQNWCEHLMWKDEDNPYWN